MSTTGSSGNSCRGAVKTDVTRARELAEPSLKFCPYCGSQNVKMRQWVPRCMDCRVVFHLQFGRHLRAAIAKEGKD